MQRLEEYHWPGNVRELENTVHRLYISEKEDLIDEGAVDSLLNDSIYDNVVIDIRKQFQSRETIDFSAVIEEQEKKLIAYALKKEKTTRKAADFLNLPQATLARKKLNTGCKNCNNKMKSRAVSSAFALCFIVMCVLRNLL